MSNKEEKWKKKCNFIKANVVNVHHTLRTNNKILKIHKNNKNNKMNKIQFLKTLR